MARSARFALDDMLAELDGIEVATAGKTFDGYRSDWLLKHAVQRAIEIISEASRAIPEDLKATRPEIPWTRVRDIGNVLRHWYHGLSDQLIWSVVIDELPKLKIAIVAIRDDFAAGKSEG